MRKKRNDNGGEDERPLAVFPGSFDPLTRGHVDIIERALTVFGSIVVGVLINRSKESLFSPQERVRLIREQCKAFGDRVHVESFSGLLVGFVNKIGGKVIIRGLRAISDFDYEAQMALVNRRLDPSIETFFMTAREENSYISSSIVKQVALLGGDVSAMVPSVVAKALKARYRRKLRGEA
jgi:pantetheine-phosphate adenylyltransferase